MSARGRSVVRDSGLEDCHKLQGAITDTMKACITVAEDLQDSSDKYSAHVDTLEKQLLEFIKMDRTLDLVKKAMKEVDVVEAAYLNGGDAEEQEEPPSLAQTFDDKLSSLREEDQYDEKRHAQWAEFQERVREEENRGGEEMEQEDDDVVMAQVQKSLRCPLTKRFLESPVTSQQCGHSYSQAAIHEHIRNMDRRRGHAKCPVCNAPITAADLKKDTKLQRMVLREQRKGGRGRGSERGVVSLN